MSDETKEAFATYTYRRESDQYQIWIDGHFVGEYPREATAAAFSRHYNRAHAERLAAATTQKDLEIKRLREIVRLFDVSSMPLEGSESMWAQASELADAALAEPK